MRVILGISVLATCLAVCVAWLLDGNTFWAWMIGAAGFVLAAAIIGQRNSATD